MFPGKFRLISWVDTDSGVKKGNDLTNLTTISFSETMLLPTQITSEVFISTASVAELSGEWQ